MDLRPTTREVLTTWLRTALPAQDAVALDAGVGRKSLLASFRPPITRLVGVDLHEPPDAVPWLDEFRLVDLCRDGDAFPPDTFHVILCAFALEHLDDPAAALRTMRHWLRPGGWLLLTTVNRRHPLVEAYLSLPAPVARTLQRRLKASDEDAHALVGRCNTPRALQAALVGAGYAEIGVRTTDHLARAWRRSRPARLLGLAGDLAAHSMPARRSTIVARARRAGQSP
jgi:SAM-dependent methyltransferase